MHSRGDSLYSTRKFRCEAGSGSHIRRCHLELLRAATFALWSHGSRPKNNVSEVAVETLEEVRPQRFLLWFCDLWLRCRQHSLRALILSRLCSFTGATRETLRSMVLVHCCEELFTESRCLFCPSGHQSVSLFLPWSRKRSKTVLSQGTRCCVLQRESRAHQYKEQQQQLVRALFEMEKPNDLSRGPPHENNFLE